MSTNQPSRESQEVAQIASADLENTTKAMHSAEFLVQELQALVSSKDGLVSELAMRDLKDAADLRLRLQRLHLALSLRGQAESAG